MESLTGVSSVYKEPWSWSDGKIYDCEGNPVAINRYSVRRIVHCVNYLEGVAEKKLINNRLISDDDEECVHRYSEENIAQGIADAMKAEAAGITPETHRYIGMFRPPFDVIWKKNCPDNPNHGDPQGYAEYRSRMLPQLKDQWLRGWFDEAQYEPRRDWINECAKKLGEFASDGDQRCIDANAQACEDIIRESMGRK